MIIKNFNQLATNELKKKALLIAEAGLNAIDTTVLTNHQFAYDAAKDTIYINGQKFPLAGFKRVIVVGAGKVVAQAAEVIEKKLGNRLSAGVIIDIVPAKLDTIVSKVGTHPLPSQANVAATKAIMQMVEDSNEEDFIITLIGGGGSSLLSAPTNISLEEERKIFQALMDSGADIIEMNTVRKHISSVKGGGLAKMAFPATVLSLIFSDVPGDHLEHVASGPTVKDTTTMQDAAKILDKYDILMHCEMDVCGLQETPKQEKYFEKVHNVLFSSAKNSLEAMQSKAHDLGLRVKVWNEAYGGEAQDLAKQIMTAIQPGQCLIGAGESVVTIHSSLKHKGSGGRNQEMALAASTIIPENTVFAAVASDGHDNSDVAGAIVDHETHAKIQALGIDPQENLKDHNEYQLLLDVEASIMTGITGSNVSDFFVCIRE